MLIYTHFQVGFHCWIWKPEGKSEWDTSFFRCTEAVQKFLSSVFISQMGITVLGEIVPTPDTILTFQGWVEHI